MSALADFRRVTLFLWFDKNAEDAVNFYLSVFKNSHRLEVVHKSGDAPGPANILTIAFELDGQTFTALNVERAAKA
jgi:predicted 3-demethylubiquinone-9 3-methyltransferase (glyoxalase superfamily)